jgi:hypothetical protein
MESFPAHRSFAPPKRFEFMMIRSIKRHQKRNFVSPESGVHRIAEIRKCENEALTLKSPLPKGSSETTKSPMGQMLCCGSASDKDADISVEF